MAGQPPKYSDPKELNQVIEEYFDQIDEDSDMTPTITGLCLWAGFESRQSFYDYEKRDGFSYTIKRARLRIENYYESRLTGQYSSGPIFALKNFGWTDKTELIGDFKSSMKVEFVDNED